MVGPIEDEDVRAARLLDTQAKAVALFAAVEARGLVAPGVREVDASNAIAGDDIESYDRERQIGGFYEELLDLGTGVADAVVSGR